MSGFNKLKLDELKQLCESKGLLYDTSTKVTRAQLIEILRQNDNDVEDSEGGSETERVEVDSDEDVEPHESDTLEMQKMRLELKLIEAKRKLQRENRFGNNVNASSEADDAVIRKLRGTLPVLNDSMDVQSFFSNLEKCFKLHDVDEGLWYKILPGCLCSNQKAQRAYGKIDLEHSKDYEYCKQEILSGFRLNTKTYYSQFQTAVRKGGESYKNFNTRLHETFEFYLNSKSIEDLESLIDDVVMNRFVESLPLGAKNFVMARVPKTSQECAELADLWYEIDAQAKRDASELQASSGRKVESAAKQPQYGGLIRGAGFRQQMGFRNQNRPPFSNQSAAAEREQLIPSSYRCYGQQNKLNYYPYRDQTKSNFRKEMCFVCGSNSHQTSEHRYGNNRSNIGRYSEFNRAAVVRKNLIDDHTLPREFIMPIFVNDCETVAMRDTGCRYTLINADLLTPQSRATGKELSLKGLFDGIGSVKLFEVELCSPKWGYDGTVRATVGAVPGLCIGVIVGNEIYRQFPQLRDVMYTFDKFETSERCHVRSQDARIAQVVTRSQTLERECTGDRLFTEANEGGVRSRRKDRDLLLTGTKAGVMGQKQNTQTAMPRGHNATPVTDSSKTVTAVSVRADRMTPISEPDVDAAGSNSGMQHGALASLNLDGICTVEGGYDTLDEQANLTRDNPTVRRSDSAQLDRRNDENSNALLGGAPNSNSLQDDTEFYDEVRRLAQMTSNILQTDDKTENMQTNSQRQRFANEQRADATLNYWFSLAEQGNENYEIDKDGVLFKRSPSWTGKNELLLALPVSRRQQVLRLSHEHSHFGRTKMVDMIENVGKMTFPKLRNMCSTFKSACNECQLFGPLRKAERVPLKPIKRIPEAFSHVSFDTMGSSLKKTKGGHRYLLVHSDMFSKYTDIVPLRNLRIDETVNALMSIWLRVGFPRKVYLDRSTTNTSKIFTALRERLGIETAFAAVGLHHTSGQSERSINTVKFAIRKFLPTCKNNWDKLIPMLQSVINNSVNETTGMSPNEIIFGHRIRGPIEILREVWLNDEIESNVQSKSVTQYLEQLHETLQQATKCAAQNINLQQARMKETYDRQSTDRKLYAGQKVLLLVPTSSNKMEASWSGPYKVVKSMGDGFNYQIQLNNRKQIYHVNMLKEFKDCISAVGVVITADTESEIDELPITAETEATDGPNKFTIGQQLTDDERKQLLDLLNDFNDVFTDRTGCTDLVEHEIELTEEKTCYTPSFKIPDALLDAVEDRITKLLAAGIIEESQSENNSPLIIIQKPGGGVRLVNSFVKLNEITKPQGYAMPDTADILSKAATSRYVSCLDMKDYFYQVKLSERSRPLTSFRTPFGTFQWCRLAQGLRNGPACAQKLMDRLLRGAGKYANSIQDDICVHSNSFSDHLAHLRDVLIRLRRAGITANVLKCRFILENLELFGHHLCTRTGEITVSDRKLEVIKNLTRPATKKKLMAFLGICQYYSNHVKGYADISYPLTELLKKNVPQNISTVWNQDCDIAWQKLKEALISKPVLRAPQNSKPFLLQTDASRIALGAAISQVDDSDVPFVVAYASRKLLPRERNYSTIELEALAIIFACQKFEQILWGRKIQLQTDHRPLEFVRNMSNKNGRLARWALILQKWDLQPTYTPSSTIKHIDGLSRMYDENE